MTSGILWKFLARGGEGQAQNLKNSWLFPTFHMYQKKIQFDDNSYFSIWFLCFLTEQILIDFVGRRSPPAPRKFWSFSGCFLKHFEEGNGGEALETLKNVVSQQAYAFWGVSRSSSVCWARINTLFYVFFHEFYNFFLHFFENVKNIRICSSNTANVCIQACMLETALRQKIFEISFSRPDESNFFCRDSRTPLELFHTLRACFKHENSRSLVGARIRSQIGSVKQIRKDLCYFSSCQSWFGSEFSPQLSSVSFHAWSMSVKFERSQGVL